MTNLNYEPDEKESLLLNFNNRDHDAYAKVYRFLYKEIYYYAHSFYKDMAIEPDDVIQDLFLNIWERDIKFSSIDKIRNYLYIAIKNSFISLCRRSNASKRYTHEINNDDYYIMHAVEAEVYTIIPDALKLLPNECARTLELFINGYNIKEIAKILNKKESTIYNQKKDAISILKRRLPYDKLFFCFLFILISLVVLKGLVN